MSRLPEGSTNPAPAGGERGAARAWTHYALIVALAGVILFWRLEADSLDDHESHAALTARAMADPNAWLMEGAGPYEIPPNTTFNHWMVPVENGRPRLVKTPLPYWLLTLTAKSGLGVTEWSARFPSAVAAILCAVVVLGIGRRMFSPRAALLGALIFTTSFCFQRWGRNARPEMLLCLGMTAAMGCFYAGLAPGARRPQIAWMIAFWAAMGMGNLAKEFVPLLLAWPLAAYVCWRQGVLAADDRAGLRLLRTFLLASAVGLAVYHGIVLIPPLNWWNGVGLTEEKGIYLTMGVCLGLPMLWYFRDGRGWRQVGPLLPTAIPGAVLMLAMFVPWMLYMAHLFPGVAAATFSEQVTERAAGTGRWPIDSPDLYLQGVLTYALPWLAFLPGAFAVALMRRFAERRPALVYLALWCVGLLLLFVAAAGKREHYLLPAMPPLCLLMGFVAEDVFFRHQWIRPGLSRWVGGVYGIVAPVGVVAAAVLCVRSPGERKWPYMLVVAAAAAVPMTAAGVLAFRRRFRPVMGLLAAAMVVMYVGNAGFCHVWDDFLPARGFFASVARIVPPDQPVYYWEDFQAEAPFYFGKDLPVARWRFASMEASVGKVEADRLWMQWIKDPNNAPWLVGLSVHNDELSKLGYKCFYSVQGLGKKKLVHVLFHREGNPRASAPASAPGGAPHL